MDLSETKFIVSERIELIEKLLCLKDSFSETGKSYIFNKNHAAHPFRHYSSLMNYLCLTCFDILGQKKDWIDFSSWLNSKKKRIVSERNLNNLDENDTLEQKLNKLHQRYISIYGVKNSFFDFILNKLTADQKTKLMRSIRASRIISEMKTWVNEKGQKVSQPPVGENYELSEEDKLRFLFKMRNSFTHNGFSIGERAHFIWKDWILKEHQKYLTFSSIYDEKVGEERISYKVANWPWTLIEILKEYCDTDNLLSKRYESKDNQNAR